MKVVLLAMMFVTTAVAQNGLEYKDQALQFWDESHNVFTVYGKHFDDNDMHDAILSFDQPGSGRIERLSDNEYNKLLKLRKAVKDAEDEIAKAHGVDHSLTQMECLDKISNAIYSIPDCSWSNLINLPESHDRVEFRGQFLLVNVPKEK